MQKFGNLIKNIREANRITQTNLSQKIGITQSAIAKFEKSRATLSLNTIKTIAQELDINPGYFDGTNPNLFAKDFYLFKIGSLLKAADPRQVKWFIENCYIIDVILLSPPMGVIGRAIRGSIADEMVYAIVLRDKFGNVFLFREVLPTIFIFNSKIEGVNAIRPTIDIAEERDNSRDIKIHFLKIPIDVYAKIKDLTITRTDLEFLFKKRAGKLTDTEEKLILCLREKNINPESLIVS